MPRGSKLSEPVTLTTDKGYDLALKECFPQEATKGLDTCQIVTKANATKQGMPIVGIRFNSVVWTEDDKVDKRTFPVMTAMTARQFISIASGIVAAHPELKEHAEKSFGFDIPDIPEGSQITGSVEGVEFVGTAITGYLVSVEGADASALALDAKAVPLVARSLKDIANG